LHIMGERLALDPIAEQVLGVSASTIADGI